LKRAVDTNVLVYVHIASMAEHAHAKRFVEAELARGVSLVVTPSILHELVHVITDARRFEPPVSMSEATSIARGYLNRTNVECLSTDERALALALDLLERHALGRKRIFDTLLAATLITHGIHEIITGNGRHFDVFEGLRAVDPLEER